MLDHEREPQDQQNQQDHQHQERSAGEQIQKADQDSRVRKIGSGK
jgi:hypothetical protein